MKMDPINKGSPHSPMKPPIKPKPKYTSKEPPPEVRLSIKQKEERTYSSSNSQIDDRSLISEESFCVSTRTSSVVENNFTSPNETTDSFSFSEEEFSSFNSSVSYNNKSVLYLDCSTLSNALNSQFSKEFEITTRSFPDKPELRPSFLHTHETDTPPKTPEKPPVTSFLHSYNQLNIFENDSSSTFHLTANLRSLIQEKNNQSFGGINSSSCSSLCDDSTFNLEDNSSSISNEVKKIANTNKKKENKAFLIAKELMSSEQVYVDALKLLLHEFKSFLVGYGLVNFVSNELDKIFNTLPQLLNFNEDLLCDLQVRINEWDQRQRIADVIVRKGPFLKLYTTYMKDFEFQCNYIDECCQKYPKFSKALREFESSQVCKNLTVKHYMLKPVQRIPHYRLLLEDYLNHVDVGSDEYNDTQTALNIVKDVLHHANSSLKLADNFCKLLQIQSSVGNYEIIKPGRLFIKEGELKKLSRKDTQPRFFILLSDCLLYTIYTTSTTGYKIKYELPLSGMKVHTHPGDGTEFSIITSTRSFTLRAKSDSECNEWVNVLRVTINENINRQLTFLNKTCNNISNANFECLKLGREAPVWIQDKSTTMCQNCTAEFTVTFRRHHCRCCGKVVCGDCSSNKAPLAYLKFQGARVCEECYKYLLQEYEDAQANMREVVKTELNLQEHEIDTAIENIKGVFKKMDSVKKITKKYVPQRLKEVTANDKGSSMCGWLSRKNKKEWKRLWFVLKDQVLYMYKASNDVVAYDSLPVLGYVVDRPVEEEEGDSALYFRLTHAGQTPVTFLAPDKKSVDLWVTALNEATVLK